jgi:energy-converting hydrogenase Eha subunit C
MTVAISIQSIVSKISKRSFLASALKEGRMKNFLKGMESLGFLCVLAACFMSFLNLLAITLASFGLIGLFNHFQYLRIPFWSVALPVLGIMILLPLALRQAFMRRSESEEEQVVAPMRWRQVADRWRSRLHFRPV